MQWMEESENPVLRIRTPKVSIAFATLQESNCRNSSRTDSSNRFKVIASPEMNKPMVALDGAQQLPSA
jgi:hypothetical protein